MRVIEPLAITDAILTASNVTEDDHAAWNIATAYSIGNRVIKVATHSVYEAVASTTGADPDLPANQFDADTNPTGVWLRVGATNRWKAFDRRISDPVSRAGSITYTLTAPRIIDAVAFFGLAAEAVTVTVKDTEGGTVTTETRAIVDTSEIIDWFTYFTWDPMFQTEALFTGLPVYAGYDIEITISAPDGTAQVGQIVPGRARNLGTTTAGTEIGIRDFSRKDRDSFGNAVLIERAFAQTVSFQFAMPTGDERRVQRILSRLRATPAVYYSDAADLARATLVYGFFPDFLAPLASAGVTFATLEVEGLI
jgi:hypothetical protein